MMIKKYKHYRKYPNGIKGVPLPDDIFDKIIDQPDDLDGKTTWQRLVEEAKHQEKAMKEISPEDWANLAEEDL